MEKGIPEKNSKSGGMVRSMLVNVAGIFGSRVTGLLRDIVMAWYWGGTGAAIAAFHLAFSIPNMFRTLFGEGAFTAAFVPAVSEKLEKGDREGAWRLAERTISLQIIALAAIGIVISAVSASICFFLPPDTREHIVLTFKALPILIHYALLICVAGSFASILNSLRHFALPSVNPVIFNAVQILSVLLLYPFYRNSEPIALYLFSAGILLSGVLQVLNLMLACRRRGFIFHFRPLWDDPDVKAVCRRFLPGTVGAGAAQINQLIDKIMVGWLGASTVSSIAYSNHLVYLPVGIFGVAMGVVCLTDMARAAGNNDSRLICEKLDLALRMVLFLSLPCAVLFGILAVPIIKVVLMRGAFNEEALSECVFALSYYLPGLPAFCCLKVATTPFHAQKDTATPVKIAIAAIILNTILNFSLIWHLRQGGLALATSLSSWFNVITLLVLIKRRFPDWNATATVKSGLCLLFAALCAGCCAWLALDKLGTSNEYARLLTGGLAGGGAYLLFCRLLKRPEIPELLSSVKRR